MLPTKHLRMTRGQTFIETFTAIDYDGSITGAPGTVINLTGYTCYFAITADMKVAALLELDSNARGGVVVSNQTTNLGQFVATITPGQSACWIPMGDDDPYFYQAWIVDGSGNRTPVRATSPLGVFKEIPAFP